MAVLDLEGFHGWVWILDAILAGFRIGPAWRWIGWGQVRP